MTSRRDRWWRRASAGAGADPDGYWDRARGRPAPEPPTPAPPRVSRGHPERLGGPDRPARLCVNISDTTETALTQMCRREGISMTEATGRLVYGQLIDAADRAGRSVVLRGGGVEEERVVLLDPPTREGESR